MKIVKFIKKINGNVELPGEYQPETLAALAAELGIAPSGLVYLITHGFGESQNNALAGYDYDSPMEERQKVAAEKTAQIVAGKIESGVRGPSGDPLANAIVAAAMVWFGAQRVRNAAKRVKANGLNAVLSESVAAALAGLDGVPVASIPADRVARAVAKKMGEFESAAKDAIARKAAMAKLDLE